MCPCDICKRLAALRAHQQAKRFPPQNGRVFLAPAAANPTMAMTLSSLVQQPGSSTLVYTVGGTLQGDPDIDESPSEAAFAAWSEHLEPVCTAEQWDRLNSALRRCVEEHQGCISLRESIKSCRFYSWLMCFLNCPCIAKMSCDLDGTVADFQQAMIRVAEKETAEWRVPGRGVVVPALWKMRDWDDTGWSLAQPLEAVDSNGTLSTRTNAFSFDDSENPVYHQVKTWPTQDFSIVFEVQGEELRASWPLANNSNASTSTYSSFKCDVSGISPIVGHRYHLTGQDWDVCEAVFQNLPADEKTRYTLIPCPPLAGPALEKALLAAQKRIVELEAEVAKLRQSARGAAPSTTVQQAALATS